MITPDHMTGAAVQRPNMVRGGEIENAVYFQGCRFDRDVGSESPSQSERIDVLGIDLVERAEPPPGVFAIVSGPNRSRWLQKHLGRKSLGGELQREGAGRQGYEQEKTQSAQP